MILRATTPRQLEDVFARTLTAGEVPLAVYMTVVELMRRRLARLVEVSQYRDGGIEFMAVTIRGTGVASRLADQLDAMGFGPGTATANERIWLWEPGR